MDMYFLLCCIIVAVAAATSIELVPSSAHVARDSDYTQACSDEFGPGASVADWDTIITALSDTELQAFYSEYDIQPFGKRLLVVRGGSMVCNEGVCTSQTFVRKYFVERHDGNPPASWDVFGQHAGLTLGSWHGGSMQVLCATMGTTTTTTSVYHDCSALPMSMNGYAHPHGCPGAVWADGSPSRSYCEGRNGLFPWWSACCHWDGTACAVGPATTSTGLATTTTTSTTITTATMPTTIAATTTTTVATTSTKASATRASTTSTSKATTTISFANTPTATTMTAIVTTSSTTTTASIATVATTKTAATTTTTVATTSTKAATIVTTTSTTRTSTITTSMTATTTTVADTPTPTTVTATVTTSTTVDTTGIATVTTTTLTTATVTKSAKALTTVRTTATTRTSTVTTSKTATTTTFANILTATTTMTTVATSTTTTSTTVAAATQTITTSIVSSISAASQAESITTAATQLPSSERLPMTTLPPESATSMATTSQPGFLPIEASGMHHLSPPILPAGITTTSVSVRSSTSEETIASPTMLNEDQNEFSSLAFAQTSSKPSNVSTTTSPTPSLTNLGQHMDERAILASASFFPAVCFVIVVAISSAMVVGCLCMRRKMHRGKPSDMKITMDDIETGPVAPLTPKIVLGVPSPAVAPRIFLGSETLQHFHKDISIEHTPWETESIPLASLRSKGLGSKGLGSMGIGSKIIRSMRQSLPGTISSPVASRGAKSPFSRIDGPQEHAS